MRTLTRASGIKCFINCARDERGDTTGFVFGKKTGRARDCLTYALAKLILRWLEMEGVSAGNRRD